jgi:hypothetical protein
MKQTIPLLFVLLALSACNESSNSDVYKPPSSGTHAEMLIVTHDTLWNGPVGEALRSTFAREQYGLPQPEGIFSVNRIRPAAFTSIFEKAKSVVFAKIGDTTLVLLQKNRWAKPQLVATFIAPTYKDLYALIKTHEDEMVRSFHQADLGVVLGRMSGVLYKSLPESLEDMGIATMKLNSGFEQTLDKEDVKIFRQQTKKTQQFLVFSKRPMREDILPGQDIVAARDTIGKLYFEGSQEDSYFATEQMIPPQQINDQIDGQFAIETRGMWKTVGDFMGGPFLSYTIYNDQTDEIFCVEGFIYGPDAKKRNIILEMEAMMKSITFR